MPCTMLDWYDHVLATVKSSPPCPIRMNIVSKVPPISSAYLKCELGITYMIYVFNFELLPIRFFPFIVQFVLGDVASRYHLIELGLCCSFSLFRHVGNDNDVRGVNPKLGQKSYKFRLFIVQLIATISKNKNAKFASFVLLSSCQNVRQK